MTSEKPSDQPNPTPDQQPPADPYAEGPYADGRAHFLQSDHDTVTQQQMEIPLPLPPRSHVAVRRGGKSRAFDGGREEVPSGDWSQDENRRRAVEGSQVDESSSGRRMARAMLASIEISATDYMAGGNTTNSIARQAARSAQGERTRRGGKPSKI
jgi:hypothetical protein